MNSQNIISKGRMASAKSGTNCPKGWCWCASREGSSSRRIRISPTLSTIQILKHCADQLGIIKHYADQLGIRFGQDVLVLKGTGNDEVAQLWVDQKGKYDNRIRSAMLQKLAQ